MGFFLKKTFFLITLGVLFFGVQQVSAAVHQNHCCLYYDVNIPSEGIECYHVSNNEPAEDTDGNVLHIDPSKEKCPENYYPSHLKGSYLLATSPIASDNFWQISVYYKNSEISEKCLDLGTGYTVQREPGSGSNVCKAGFEIARKDTNFTKKLIDTQHADLKKVATKLTLNEYGKRQCCVYMAQGADEARKDCKVFTINEKKIDELAAAQPGFLFPTDEQFEGQMMSCDPANPSEGTWLEYSSDLITTRRTGGYVVIPEECNNTTGANYIPPWFWGPNPGTAIKLNAMCKMASDKYCPCNDNETSCYGYVLYSEEECKKQLPMSGMTQCVKITGAAANIIHCKTYSDTVKVKEEKEDEDILIGLPSAAVLNQLPDTSVQKLIGRMIRFFLGVVGSLALAMTVLGGFLWMTAMGNAERAKKAQSIILWSFLGLIVMLSSYALLNFVFEALQ